MGTLAANTFATDALPVVLATSIIFYQFLTLARAKYAIQNFVLSIAPALIALVVTSARAFSKQQPLLVRAFAADAFAVLAIGFFVTVFTCVLFPYALATAVATMHLPIGSANALAISVVGTLCTPIAFFIGHFEGFVVCTGIANAAATSALPVLITFCICPPFC